MSTTRLPNQAASREPGGGQPGRAGADDGQVGVVARHYRDLSAPRRRGWPVQPGRSGCGGASGVRRCAYPLAGEFGGHVVGRLLIDHPSQRLVVLDVARDDETQHLRPRQNRVRTAVAVAHDDARQLPLGHQPCRGQCIVVKADRRKRHGEITGTHRLKLQPCSLDAEPATSHRRAPAEVHVRGGRAERAVRAVRASRSLWLRRSLSSGGVSRCSDLRSPRSRGGSRTDRAPRQTHRSDPRSVSIVRGQHSGEFVAPSPACRGRKPRGRQPSAGIRCSAGTQASTSGMLVWGPSFPSLFQHAS